MTLKYYFISTQHSSLFHAKDLKFVCVCVCVKSRHGKQHKQQILFTHCGRRFTRHYRSIISGIHNAAKDDARPDSQPVNSQRKCGNTEAARSHSNGRLEYYDPFYLIPISCFAKILLWAFSEHMRLVRTSPFMKWNWNTSFCYLIFAFSIVHHMHGISFYKKTFIYVLTHTSQDLKKSQDHTNSCIISTYTYLISFPCR